MVKTENVTINNKEYKKTYSTLDYYVRNKATKEEYSEAVDCLESTNEYMETRKKIEGVLNDET